MWGVTQDAAFDLQRRVLEHEWSLLVRVALKAACVSSR